MKKDKRSKIKRQVRSTRRTLTRAEKTVKNLQREHKLIVAKLAKAKRLMEEHSHLAHEGEHNENSSQPDQVSTASNAEETEGTVAAPEETHTEAASQ